MQVATTPQAGPVKQASESWSEPLTFVVSRSDGVTEIKTLQPRHGLCDSMTIAQLKGLLKDHFSLPEWMTSLSYRGQSLDGMAGKTVQELGIVAGSQLQVELLDLFCPKHPESIAESVCLECQERLCGHCVGPHLTATNHKRICGIPCSDADEDTFFGAVRPYFDGAKGAQSTRRLRCLKDRVRRIDLQVEALQKERSLVVQEMKNVERLTQVQEAQWKAESLPFLLEELKVHQKRGEICKPAQLACDGCGEEALFSELSDIAVKRTALKVCPTCVGILSSGKEIYSDAAQQALERVRANLVSVARTREPAETLPLSGAIAFHSAWLGTQPSSFEGLLEPDFEALVRELEAEGEASGPNQLGLPRVRWIRCSGPGSASDLFTRCATAILAVCPNLIGLELMSVTSQRWIRDILSSGLYSNGLMWLTISGDGISEAALHTLPRYNSLRSIKVSGPLINDEAVIAISASVGLTALDLSHCYHITDVSARYIAKVPRLTSLNLSWCYQLTDAGAQEIAKLPALTSLNLALCYRLTSEGTAKINKLRLASTTVLVLDFPDFGCPIEGSAPDPQRSLTNDARTECLHGLNEKLKCCISHVQSNFMRQPIHKECEQLRAIWNHPVLQEPGILKEETRSKYVELTSEIEKQLKEANEGVVKAFERGVTAFELTEFVDRLDYLSRLGPEEALLLRAEQTVRTFLTNAGKSVGKRTVEETIELFALLQIKILTSSPAWPTFQTNLSNVARQHIRTALGNVVSELAAGDFAKAVASAEGLERTILIPVRWNPHGMNNHPLKDDINQATKQLESLKLEQTERAAVDALPKKDANALITALLSGKYSRLGVDLIRSLIKTEVEEMIRERTDSEPPAECAKRVLAAHILLDQSINPNKQNDNWLAALGTRIEGFVRINKGIARIGMEAIVDEVIATLDSLDLNGSTIAALRSFRGVEIALPYEKLVRLDDAVNKFWSSASALLSEASDACVKLNTSANFTSLAKVLNSLKSLTPEEGRYFKGLNLRMGKLFSDVKVDELISRSYNHIDFRELITTDQFDRYAKAVAFFGLVKRCFGHIYPKLPSITLENVKSHIAGLLKQVADAGRVKDWKGANQPYAKLTTLSLALEKQGLATQEFTCVTAEAAEAVKDLSNELDLMESALVAPSTDPAALGLDLIEYRRRAVYAPEFTVRVRATVRKVLTLVRDQADPTAIPRLHGILQNAADPSKSVASLILEENSGIFRSAVRRRLNPNAA